MEFNFNIFLIVVESIVAAQCFFVGLLFLVNQNNKGNKFLGIYLIIRSLNFVNLITSQVSPEYSISIFYVSTSLYGPLLILYLYNQLNIEKSNLFISGLLVIPFLISVAWFSVVMDLNGIDNMFMGMRDIPVDTIYTLLICYAFYLISNTEKKLDEHLRSKIKYLWLKALFAIAFFQMIFYYSVLMLFDLGLLSLSNWFLFSYLVFVIVFINGLIFVGFKYPDIIIGTRQIKDRLQENPENKYSYSDLTKEEASQIIKRLEEVVIKEQLYKNPDLKLEDVAYKIAKIPKDVSQTVNQYLNKNFKEYINDIRITTASELLIDPEKEDWRISDVMYEVGFNSKSSFNTYFKKRFEMTPKQFKKRPNEYSPSTNKVSK